jgi:hypothetical protein
MPPLNSTVMGGTERNSLLSISSPTALTPVRIYVERAALIELEQLEDL